MRVLEIESFTEFFDAVTELQSRIEEPWYRGLNSTSLSLLPSLYWRNLMSQEESIATEFMIYQSGLPGDNPSGPWELYTLMRHHGLPTRLLDWTRSPLVALYFALESSQGSDDAAVWSMDPRKLNRWAYGSETFGNTQSPSEFGTRRIPVDGSYFELDAYLPYALDPTQTNEYPDLPLAIEPPMSNARITAQSGCFTIHGKRSEGIEQIFDELGDEDSELVRLEIKGSKKHELLASLWALGIREEVIYQDLDSLSRRIIRVYGTTD